MKLVRIDWIDSTLARSEWENIDGLEAVEPVHCISVGFLIEDKPEYKTLAHSKTETQVCGRITIPTACIKKCKGLR